MANYKLIESGSGLVQNIVLWDGESEYNVPEGYILQLITESIEWNGVSSSLSEFESTPYSGDFLGNFYGKLYGSSSYALTASYALNGGSGTGTTSTGSFTGSFTGSVYGDVTGSLTGSLTGSGTGSWTGSTYYAEGDIVRYGGKLYIAIDGHLSSAGFDTDWDAGNKWNLFVDGISWKTTVWTASTLYKEGDLARHGGRVFIGINGNTSTSSFETDFNAAKWQLFADGSQWKGTWGVSTLYKVGDVVSYGGKTYQCVDEHTSLGST